MDKILNIKKITPRQIGVFTAIDDWVIETQKDNGRYPNDNEWDRFRKSALNGEIGMSFALQWRYNFSSVFRGKS